MIQSISAVIPVLDLMIGQIVLAKSGNRAAYRPVHSRLTNSSSPRGVAQAIFNQTGCDCLYLADIDSFAGANPNWAVYNELLNLGFGLWIDADWTTGERCDQISEKIENRERMKVIVSSETMASPDEFAKFDDLIARDIEPIFSLDRKGDTMITQPGELAELTPLELVQLAYGRGVRNLILLDLDSVGTMAGISNDPDGLGPLIQEITSELKDITLISGGGVRDAADVQALLDSGCQHVLVASAIHECKLTPDDVSQFRVAGGSA
jgi:phosphoribosylformimino-5-aminoimidazole carboxamide ribotide isomerase